jgi:phosphatidylglycerophosphatase A
MNKIEQFLGSGFLTGYIPFASGTWASLAALAIYWLPGFERPEVMIPITIAFTIYGILIGNKFEKKYGKDPAECTIDEVIGMWISLLFLPKRLLVSIAAFFIWRVLDIVKPPVARQVEALPGGLGIMLDDVVSALYTLILMHILIRIFPAIF